MSAPEIVLARPTNGSRLRAMATGDFGLRIVAGVLFEVALARATAKYLPWYRRHDTTR